MDRRIFLKKVIKIFIVIFTFIFSAFTLINLIPSSPKRRNYQFYKITEDMIPHEGVRKINLKIESSDRIFVFFIVNHHNSIFALSPYCTHLGCLVSFDRNSNEFLCPCHQGRYDIYGKVLSGPPKEPLSRLPLREEKGEIFIGILT